MRSQFAALSLCCLLLVACATDGQRQPYVHPKARKTDAIVTAMPTKQVPAPIAVAPAIQSRAPSPVVAAPVVVPPVRQAPPVAPSLPQVFPSTGASLPSEIPTRAPRRDIPSWTTPPARTPQPAIVRMVPVPVVPVPAPARVPVPVPVPTPSTSPGPVPQPALQPQIASQITTPSARTSQLIIDRAMGAPETRLACNRAGSPHCDLRIYQVNVSSFVDGSSDHDAKAGYGPGPHTGDIEGVIGALDHIKALGFNTIWLTPIFETAAGQPQLRPNGRSQVNERLDGTGYFPRDYFKIDPQFGTFEQTQALVDQAHLLGIKVMFDGVFGHHKGNVAPSPSGVLPIDAMAASAYDGAPQNYPGRIVDYNNPASTAFYKEVARYWIDTLGIDGWRLDQVYQVPSAPLREITAEITRAANAQLLSGYVVGEMWGSADQIRAVLGPTNNPALASAFDFPTRYALIQALATDENGGTNKPASTINEAWAMGAHATYPDHAIMNLMLGNHDLVRFGDLLERAGKGGPDTPAYWAIHKAAFTFMAAWSGPITLYYGEELGAEVEGFAQKVTNNCAPLNQCDDHVGRSMVAIARVNMRAEGVSAQSKDLQEYVTALMELRSNAPTLSSGARTHVYSDNDLYIDLKSNGSERYLLVMNVSDRPRQAGVKASAVAMTSLAAAPLAAGNITATIDANNLKLVIPPHGAAIFKLEGR